MVVSEDSVILENNDLCICGSGKTFEHCCKIKDHIYKSLGTNYTGNHSIYDHTESTVALTNLFDFIDSRIKKQTTNAKLSKEDALRKLKRLYEKFDKALMPIHRISSCRNGCSHCCYGMVVYTSLLEFEMIESYLKDNFTEDHLKNFKAKINDNKLIFTDLVYHEGKFSGNQLEDYCKLYTPCAFLDENNKCTIYEVRPFECRKYLVFNKPIDCSKRFGNDLHYYSPYLDIVREAISNLNESHCYSSTFAKHLLTWFIDI